MYFKLVMSNNIIIWRLGLYPSYLDISLKGNSFSTVLVLLIMGTWIYCSDGDVVDDAIDSNEND